MWRLPPSRRHVSWFSERRVLYRTVASWAKNDEVDVVEAPDYLGLTAFWPKMNAPIISRLHGSSTYYAAELGARRDWKTYQAERASLLRADFLCSCSSYAAERTMAIFRLKSRKVQVIYNTVLTPARHADLARYRHKVVFSGTLARKKGILSLARAWPLVVQQCPDAELHIYGKDYPAESGGSMREHALTTIPEPVRKSLYFHGHVDSLVVRRALQTARAAIFPSYSEAFALAPMEAMAEGCATVYTRRSSGAELINDGVDGLLIDPDKPDEIASAIVRLLSNDDLAETLGRAGRQRVLRDFSMERIVRENECFYERCIRSFSAPDFSRESSTPAETAHNSHLA